LFPGVKELELGVRDAATLRIHRGRLRAIALGGDLDEALAGVDLVAQDLAKVAGLGAKDFLKDGRVTPAVSGWPRGGCVSAGTQAKRRR